MKILNLTINQELLTMSNIHAILATLLIVSLMIFSGENLQECIDLGNSLEACAIAHNIK